MQVRSANVWGDALVLGVSWAIITIVFNLFGWVLIKHPWRMTFKEMYVDYQPWITLIYISIFYFLIYFLLNFFMYAAIYAGLGALVKRPEEVAGATAIPTVIMVVGLLGIYLEVLSPNLLWVKALSYIPFLTPLLMLGRIASGNVAGWEIGVTIVLMLVSIYLLTLGAVRIYRHRVLSYGQRPGLGELWKLTRK